MKNIILSTTNELNGYVIQEYKNVITANTVIGTGAFTDFFAGVTDLVGGNSNTYEKHLAEMTNITFDKLKIEATGIGANAVIGIKIDYSEISGKGKQMFMATITGTAVKVSSVNLVRVKRLLANLDILEDTNKVLEENSLFEIGRSIKSLDSEDYKIIYNDNNLLKYYIMIGELTKVDDLIFERIKNSNYIDKENLIQFGLKLYSKLLLNDDDYLIKRGLPREEVLDAITQLKKIDS